MYEKIAVAYFEAASQSLETRSEENHKKCKWFPNGVSGGTTRCVAKLKKIFKLRLMIIINN
jgi:hypothetical protein